MMYMLENLPSLFLVAVLLCNRGFLGGVTGSGLPYISFLGKVRVLGVAFAAAFCFFFSDDTNSLRSDVISSSLSSLENK